MKGRGFGLRPFICPRVHARGIVFLFFEKTGLYYDCIHYSGQGCRAETRRRKAKALEGIQAREPNRLGVHGAVRNLVRLRVPPAHHLGRLFQLLPSGQPRRRPLWRRRTGQRVRRIPELPIRHHFRQILDWYRPCAALHRHPGADHDHRRPCAGYGHRFVCRQARYRFPSGLLPALRHPRRRRLHHLGLPVQRSDFPNRQGSGVHRHPCRLLCQQRCPRFHGQHHDLDVHRLQHADLPRRAAGHPARPV